jgi:hypothetical protein
MKKIKEKIEKLIKDITGLVFIVKDIISKITK